MLQVNKDLQTMPKSYLFSTVAQKVKKYKESHPDNHVISLGIGDVTRPLVPSVIDAMHKAADEMASFDTFQGYPPEQGYQFLREAIAADYARRNIQIDPEDIFVSDGAKSDCGNLLDLFASSNKVAVCDPVYPVYVDTNAMRGSAGTFNAESGIWDNILYLPCSPANDFLPDIPSTNADILYLCSPNNPTGTCLSKEALKLFVDYALDHHSVILYDSAYEAFIREDYPHSIYEIENASKCAIEIRSFSKTAGFTGIRCAYTVVPKDLIIDGASLHDMWLRRHATKFNGVSYLIQRAAEATLTDEGRKQTMSNIDYYLENAKLLKSALVDAGITVYGGVNAPYLWLQTPNHMSSWDTFDLFLHNLELVGTPGSGFGPHGEGFIRLTSFGSRENTLEAIERIKRYSF